MKFKIFMAMCAALLVNSASAHGGGLWATTTIGLCLAQDPGYASLPSGRAWMQDASMPRFIASLPPEAKRCLVAKKAESAELCKALLSPEPNPGPSDEELDKLYARYRTEIEKLNGQRCDVRK